MLKQIKIITREQEITCNSVKVASGLIEQIECDFVIEGDKWNYPFIIANFHNPMTNITKSQLIEDGKCQIPWEVLTDIGKITVNLEAFERDGKELVKRMTSYKTVCVVVEQKVHLQAEPSATPEAWEQIIAHLQEQIDNKIDEAPNDGQQYARQNEDWSVVQGGGGGSSKKNAYASISKIRDYAYQSIFTDIDYQKAFEHFATMKPVPNVMNDNYRPEPAEKFGCNAFYFHGIVGRTYDWLYSNTAEFVVKTPAMNERMAVMGVGSVTNLTASIVDSGLYNEMFDYLPFQLVDGMNEDGLFIASLVAPIDNGITTGTTPQAHEYDEICTLMLPRYVLDRCSTVEQAVRLLERNSVFNAMGAIEMGFELHFYIADAYGTRGVIEFVDNTVVFNNSDILTNFVINGVQFNDDGSVYTPATQDSEHNAIKTNLITPHGSGLERYNLINSALPMIKSQQDIQMLLYNLRYSNAYDRKNTPYWYTEFVGGETYTVTTDPKVYDAEGGIVDRAIQAWQDKDRNDPQVWHTVHGGLYDLENKAMYLVFQEDMENIYAFGLNYYTRDQIDDMIGDLGYGNVKFSEHQDLGNYEFNTVMENLRLGARIDEYFDVTNIFDAQEIDIAPVDLTYTIPKVLIKPFKSDREYEVLLSFGEYGTINIHGYYKNDTLLALDGEIGGIVFEMLEYDGDNFIIRFKTDIANVPNLTGITLNELALHRSVTPINSELIPQDNSKQDREDYGLATVDKTIVGAVNEVNERVDNISQQGRFLSYWNAATGMPETNPSTIPFEYKSGDWFSISVVATEGGTNYAPTPNAYDGTPSTVVEKNLIEKGDVYRYDGTTWSWEHTVQRDVQFRDILGSPFDNTALNNAFALKEDISNKSNVVNNSTDEYLTGAAMLQYLVAGNNGVAKSTSDANTARATGFYTCYRTAHLPSVANWGALLVIQGSNSGSSFETVQVFFPYAKRFSPWYRVWDNSADWSEWKEFALSNNVVQKTPTGQIEVEDAINDNEAVSLGQLNTAIGNAMEGEY